VNEQTDSQLLRAYAGHRSELAFTELVRRHVDLVYSAALRMVVDAHLAQDVTQGVFVALVKNAARLADRPVLAGWLHRTAQNIAAQTVRSEVRRRAREQEAAVMSEVPSAEPGVTWDAISPLLDHALGEMNEPDRDAILMRFFEHKSAREMAQVLGISDDAAQKRVSRAVERLREFFAKRGVTAGASGLVVVISANAVQAAPAGLAVTISTAATVAGTTLATTATATITKVIAMTTLQKTLVTASIAVLAGAGIFEARQAARLREQNQTLQQQQAPLAEQIQQLQRERDEARSQLAALRAEKAQSPEETAELLRLRGMAGVARRAMAEADQLRAQLARQVSETATNLITGAMADAMTQAVEQQMEGRLTRMTASLHLTPDQVQAARDILMRQARAMSAGMQQAFSGKFDRDEFTRLGRQAGNPDEQIKALLSPDQLASYPAYQREEAAHNAGQAANNDLMQMQTTLGLTPEQMDRVYAALYEVNFNQLVGNTKPTATDQAEAMQWMLDQKIKAVEPLLTESQLKIHRQQQALQAKLVKDILNKMTGSGDPK
jgi:RNA polymerase sigma factor (sigma-70 family)